MVRLSQQFCPGIFLFLAVVYAAESDVTVGNGGAERPPIGRAIGRVHEVTSGETGARDDGWQRSGAPLRTPFEPRRYRQFKAYPPTKRRPLRFASEEEEASTSAAVKGVDVAVRAKFSSSATSAPRTRLEPPSECCLRWNAREYELISQILPELTLLARRPVGPRRPTTWLSPEGAPKRAPEVGKVLRDRHS